MAKFLSAIKALLGGGNQRRFKKSRSRRQKRFTGVRGEGAYYGWFLEFGTQNTAPQPFLQPALERNRSRAEQVFINEVKRGVDRIVDELAAKSARL